MSFTDTRLWRARALEPVVALNELVLLVDSNGPVRKRVSPFYQVVGVQPIFGFNAHGVLVIWTQGTIPAGYTLPAGAPTGTITAGSSVQFVNPTILQNGPSQLTQLRWAIRPLALTGVQVDDIDVQFFMGSIGMFGTLNASPGFANMADQYPPASDVSLEPAQAANMTAVTGTPSHHTRDLANLSEFFVWENNAPTIKVINNGAASLTAGTIALRMWGFRYDLAVIGPDGSWQSALVMGTSVKAPPVKFVTIPVAPFVGTGSYSS
jgi:hypothetical protein